MACVVRRGSAPRLAALAFLDSEEDMKWLLVLLLTACAVAPTTPAPLFDVEPEPYIHAGDLDATVTLVGREGGFDQYLYVTSAEIHDAAHAPVVGALLTLSMQGRDSTCVTDAGGRCGFTGITPMKRADKDWYVHVRSVVGPAPYTPSDSHDPEGDFVGGLSLVFIRISLR
jgi:hypothetical protein